MLARIKELPEVGAIAIWAAPQAAYLRHEKQHWQVIGMRLDYLLQLEAGYLPADPAERADSKLLCRFIQVETDYFFAILRCIIAGWDALRFAAAKDGRPIQNFKNPRHLFAECCREISECQMAEATSRHIGVGITMTEQRQLARSASKFIGNSPKAQELRDEMREFLKGSALWTPYILATLRDQPMCMKQSTRLGVAWAELKRTQRDFARILDHPDLGTIRWNAGHPVWSATDKPVRFPDSS